MLPVFCTPGEEQPLKSHGFHDASTDRASLSGLGAALARRENRNTESAAGVDVVDVQPGCTGFRAFERFGRGHPFDSTVSLLARAARSASLADQSAVTNSERRSAGAQRSELRTAEHDVHIGLERRVDAIVGLGPRSTPPTTSNL